MIRINNPMSITAVTDGKTLVKTQDPCDAETVSTPPQNTTCATGKEPTKTLLKNTTTNLKIGLVFRNTFDRIRRVKHIEIYAAVVVIAVMLMIFIMPFGGTSDRPNNNNNGPNLTGAETNFIRDMERQLVTVLSNVRGAGRVEAMVTAVGSSTLEIAMSIDERTVTQAGQGGASTTTTTVTKTPIIVGGAPVVITETKPQIRGVVIVATGASDPAVRFGILRAVQTLVADHTVRIEVLSRA